MIAPPPVICSRMRVAPPQKRAPQLLHWTDGDVACSVSTVTVAQDLAFALGHCFWRRTHARGAAGGVCGLVESEARLHDADVCVLARFGGRF